MILCERYLYKNESIIKKSVKNEQLQNFDGLGMLRMLEVLTSRKIYWEELCVLSKAETKVIIEN